MDVYVGEQKQRFSVPTNFGEALRIATPRFLRSKTIRSGDSSWDEVHDGSLSLQEDDPDFEEFAEQIGSEIITHISRREPVYLHQCTIQDFEAAMAWAKKKVVQAKDRVQVPFVV